MPIGPGVLIAGTCAASYAYWRYSFRQVTAAMRMEQLGRLDEARELLRRFLRNRNPITRRGESRARCRLLLARLERKAGHYEQAVQEADDLLSTDCSEGIAVAALQVQSDALAWAGNLERAIAAAGAARSRAERARLTSFVPEIDGLLVRLWSWSGDLPRAREAAEQIAQSDRSTRYYGFLRLAEIERLEGNFSESIGWCQKLEVLLQDQATAAARPGQVAPALWLTLARLHAARSAWLSGSPSRAAELLEQDPQDPDRLPRADAVAWWGLRSVVASSPAAASDCTRAMEKAAESAPPGYGSRAWLHYYRARVEMARGNFAAAAPGIAEAIRDDPPAEARAEMFYALGRCLLLSGQAGAAGAFACGARQPPSFYFSRLCREESLKVEMPG